MEQTNPLTNLMKQLIGSTAAIALLWLFAFLQATGLESSNRPTLIGVEVDGDAKSVCVISDPAINEASGIAISRQNPDAVWIHNDSGDLPRLFLVGFDGQTKAVVTVRDVVPMDWEDMCSFELDGEKWLLIGDIGDNGHVRGQSAPVCQLLLLKEPTAGRNDRSEPEQVAIEVFATLDYSYPDGPRDCESLAVDTTNREILLLSKSDPFNCALFRLPLSLKKGNSTVVVESIASLGVPYATAMDISPDGRRLVVVNMFSGAMVERQDPESWSDACRRPVTLLTLPKRKQGESVCFTADGGSLLLNSEKRKQPLWKIELEKSLHGQAN